MEIKDIDALYEELREARAFMEALNDGILSVRIKRDEYKWMIPDESDTSFKSFCDCWERWTTLTQKVFEKINGSFLFLDKETTDAQNTAGTGRCGDYTTAPRQIQGGI